MPEPRDAVATLLGRVRARLRLREATLTIAAAAMTAAVLLAAGSIARTDRATSAAVALTFGGAVAIMQAVRRGVASPRAAAYEIERRAGPLRNLIVTAEELLGFPDRCAPYMRARVLRDAATAASRIEPRRVVPIAAESAAAIVALAALAAAAGTPRLAHSSAQATPIRGGAETAVSTIEIAVSPPEYARLPEQHLRNPQAIEALAGSAIAVRIPGVGRPGVRLNGVALRADEGGTARATLVESGGLAVDGGAVHTLVPITVTPDAVPEVRITQPARDVRVTDTKTSIAVHAAATDDLGLRLLEIRYTIVSGGGEQFTFNEGTLPATLARASSRAWSADAAISLAALHLDPGDAVVYRAVAADARPGAAGEASSDTYFVEVAGPGDVPLEGVDMPSDRERYALSQAMIVMKIQRLLARQVSLPRVVVEETAATIAAEQRAVRANFIFMLGGEVEDEVVEAETSHEIQEGRLANQARREIVAATVLMGKVEQALAAGTPRAALPPAEDAVRTLQRAFGHSRYLLRALPARIRIDPSRRLSGDLATVRDWHRDLVPAAPDPRTEAARAALAELLDLSGHLDAAVVPRLTGLAERLLAIDPGAADLQQASRRLIGARDALSHGDLSRADAAIDEAAGPLVTRAGRGRIDARPLDADAMRLAGAVAAGGGGR